MGKIELKDGAVVRGCIFTDCEVVASEEASRIEISNCRFDGGTLGTALWKWRAARAVSEGEEGSR